MSKRIEAMALTRRAVNAIEDGRLDVAWYCLDRASGIVDEMIEDTVEKDE